MAWRTGIECPDGVAPSGVMEDHLREALCSLVDVRTGSRSCSWCTLRGAYSAVGSLIGSWGRPGTVPGGVPSRLSGDATDELPRVPRRVLHVS